MDPEVCARIVVKGRVQGVFYRVYARDIANRLGLKGYSKNEADGSVVVIVCGFGPQVGQFVELCKIGPADSQVESVEHESVKTDENFVDFEIR